MENPEQPEENSDLKKEVSLLQKVIEIIRTHKPVEGGQVQFELLDKLDIVKTRNDLFLNLVIFATH